MEPVQGLWEFVQEGGVSGLLFLTVIYLAMQNRQKEADQKELVRDLRGLSVDYATLAATVKSALDAIKERLSGK